MNASLYDANFMEADECLTIQMVIGLPFPIFYKCRPRFAERRKWIPIAFESRPCNMKFSSVLLFTSTALAAPASPDSFSRLFAEREVRVPAYDWSSGWVKDFPIHSSCNETQYNQLRSALEETEELAAHARDHTLRFGNNSDFFRLYFGNETASAEVIGWFDSIVSEDKSALTFRCDNPDGNCDLEGYAGHWRGENGSDETVICDLSFSSRLSLTKLCSAGFTVGRYKNTNYWSADLLHRIWHTDAFGKGAIGHYADTYEDVLELAKTNGSRAVRNSASLILYALDIYAHDISVPGVGCNGIYEFRNGKMIQVPEQYEEESPKTEDKTTTTAADIKATATNAMTSNAETADAETEIASNCHTHDDGSTHCADDDEVQDKPATTSESDSEQVATHCHTHEDGNTHCGEEEVHHEEHDHSNELPPSAVESEQSGTDCHNHADGTVHCAEHEEEHDHPTGSECHTHADGSTHCV